MLDKTIKEVLDDYARKLEGQLEADVLSYFGVIYPNFVKEFRNEVEKLATREGKRDRLAFFISTPGGLAETTENMADIVRHHYEEVDFVVPDEAKSAGTILCMSGDRIWMDYTSSLGPIDPQVLVQEPGRSPVMVPALGYLDKIKELVEKSRDGIITAVEFQKVLDMDLAMLRRYEQARDLSIALLKKWLVTYKFKNWTVHGTDPAKKGLPVTQEEKEERAEAIASFLSDNNVWHTHGRRIGINTLTNDLRLQIDDFGKSPDLKHNIRVYNDVMADYVFRQKYNVFIHSAEPGGK